MNDQAKLAALRSLRNSPGYRALVEVMDEFVRRRTAELLAADEPEQVLRDHARARGARDFYEAVKHSVASVPDPE